MTTVSYELKLYPKKDGTWGWRWHDNDTSRDFGPTFELMDVAHTWLDSRKSEKDDPVGNSEKLLTENELSDEERWDDPITEGDKNRRISVDAIATFNDVDFDVPDDVDK